MRLPIGGNSKPYPACSSSFQAAPSPRIARPLDTTSKVVTIFTSRAGLRYVTPVTRALRRMVLVLWESAARVVYDSSIGSVSEPTPRI